MREVSIKVIPFPGSASKARYFLVLFEDIEPGIAQPARPKPSRLDSLESSRLRSELAATREYLQTVVDDKATTLEELRVANEEAQAGNE